MEILQTYIYNTYYIINSQQKLTVYVFSEATYFANLVILVDGHVISITSAVVVWTVKVQTPHI